MIKKFLKLSFVIAAAGLLFASQGLAMPDDDDMSVLARLGYFGPAFLEPGLSNDGMTLYNAGLPVVYVANPGPSLEPLRIPAPIHLLAAPESVTATFQITYVPNGGTDPWGQLCYTFPAQAQASFDAAANIWANIIQSSVPITIRACWANLGSSSVLGYSGGAPLRRDFSGAPCTNTWYSGSLANALAGVDLDPSSFDMHMTYNLNFPWYYGTDGNTPAGQLDLMSVVLHEITHGLNFSGSMSYSAGSGSWGYGTGYPNIYDTLMKDGSGNQLINTSVYPNPSTALGSALTSNNIWFHGSNAMAANGGARVKIYAPSTWSGGSSYSHLDYTTFNNTINQLMVYALSSGESVHDPGPVTKGLLEDLGWQIGPASLPDLIETTVSDPPTVSTAGASFSVTDTVTNQGSFPAVASITSYYLSLDTTKSIADILLTGSRAVPSLAINGTNSGILTVTIPFGIAAGSYYLLACADDTNLVAESNENNNCIASVNKVSVITSPPPAANLISPSGTITTTTPPYTWNAASTATDYYLWVNDSTGNRIQQWYTAAACGCGSGTGTCSVTPATALNAGAGQWWIQARNAVGSGPWSSGMSITIQIPLAAATPLTPAEGSTITTSTPTYTWTAVPAATWYYLSADDPTGNRILQWYTSSSAGCGSGIGNCSVTPSTTLSSGACKWKVQTWNNSSGFGSWSSQVSFTINVPAPPVAPTLISPTGSIASTSPTYTWNAVSNATDYFLWVNDSSGNRIQQWYTAAASGCGSGTGTCSVTPATTLNAGAAQWWVQAKNSVGTSPWSTPMSFIVQGSGPPGAATLISPNGSITTSTPTYTWNAVSNSTWYYLWVNDSAGNRIQQWYTAAAVGCPAGTGTCSITPATILNTGTAQWWIQTWNSSGAGPWSAPTSFVVP